MLCASRRTVLVAEVITWWETGEPPSRDMDWERKGRRPGRQRSRNYWKVP